MLEICTLVILQMERQQQTNLRKILKDHHQNNLALTGIG